MNLGAITNPEGPSYAYSPAGNQCLEIGGGPYARRLNYLQFDLKDWSERTGLQYELGDARCLPYYDGQFDHIYSSNLLEHFTNTADVLQEWCRVIRVGGILELVVPDAMGILSHYFNGTNSWDECQERIVGSDDYEGNQHMAAFTVSTFPRILIAAVPCLDIRWCVPCHNDGGIWVVAVKKP